MKILTLSALALSVAVVSFANSANAQVRTEPLGKLFFDGDIVSHAMEGQQGPFCQLQNQFKRGEAMTWRMRIYKPDGNWATDKDLKSVVAVLGDGQMFPLHFGRHGNPAETEMFDSFWSSRWEIPLGYPTGTVGYKIVATMQDGTEVTWRPVTRAPSQLTIIPGAPVMTASR